MLEHPSISYAARYGVRTISRKDPASSVSAFAEPRLRRGILRDYTLDLVSELWCLRKIESGLHGDMQTAIEIFAAPTKVGSNNFKRNSLSGGRNHPTTLRFGGATRGKLARMHRKMQHWGISVCDREEGRHMVCSPRIAIGTIAKFESSSIRNYCSPYMWRMCQSVMMWLCFPEFIPAKHDVHQ